MLNNPTTSSPRPSLEVSSRIALVDLGAVRITRGCDAESVLHCIGDATHPKFLRWVFNVAVKPTGKARDLRFWKEELTGAVNKWADPKFIIGKILGTRRSFPRGEIEVQWTISPQTILRLVRAGELAEVNHELTRDSLAAFLERRLQ